MSDEEPLETENPSLEYAATKRRIIIMLFGYSAIMGVIYCFLPSESPLDYVITLPILVMAISWCLTDARERDLKLGRLWRLFLIFFFFIAFPIYLFRTRGIGGLFTLIGTIVIFVGMMICSFAFGIATLYVGMVLGLWRFA